MTEKQYDVIVLGGGVIGCAVTHALLSAEPSLKTCLVEKEEILAAHQSGRNSGVVHVGYNQKPGTLKARLVVEGSRRLREFCRAHRVGLDECGIFVVALDDGEAATLKILEERGRQNGARVSIVSGEDLRAREPYAAGMAALHAPEGASFDSRGFVLALAALGREAGADYMMGERVVGLEEHSRGITVRTSRNRLQARVLVNAAGLHADTMAGLLGLSAGYQIIPFLGYYSELAAERAYLCQTHLYACPDLKFPFLGVHLSRNYDGRVRVGPGAVLAPGREAYHLWKWNAGDLLRMLRFRGFWRMLISRDFLRLSRQEWKKSLSRRAVAAEARQLVPQLQASDLKPSRAGIRAQLVARDGRLVDDLVVETTERSVHILNAVSPALTCSLPFAELIAQRVIERL